MPTLVRLKNGETVIAEGDVTPEKLRRMGATIVGSNGPKATPAPAPKSDMRSGIARAGQAGGKSTEGWMNRAVNSLTFGLDDKLGALGSAALSYIPGAMGKSEKNLEGKSFGERYDIYSGARGQMRNEEAENNPGYTLTADVAGAVANPLGAETGAGKVISKVAPRAAQAFKGSRAGSTIARGLESTPLRTMRAGGNQAAAQALVNGGDVADEYAVGGALGLGMGLGIKGGGKVVSAIRNRSADAADRIAARRAGEIIGRARDDAGNVMTPKSVEERIAQERAAGSQSAVMDISPESMNTAAALARKPGLENANQLVRFGENRIEDAGNRFNENLNKSLSPNGAQISATQGKAALNAERQSARSNDYRDEVMKAELQDTPDMMDFIQNAPAATQRALRMAAENVGRGATTAKLALEFDDAGKPVFTKIPNMAVLDEVKKAFDDMIGESYKAGTRAHVGIREELDLLRKIVADQNPEYAKSLYNQRGYFEKIAALEEGTNFLSRLQKEPEQLLMDLKASKKPIEGVKYGVADAILALRHTQTEPLKRLRGMMRSKEQREVMKWLMGDEQKFNNFYKFMKTELNNSAADSLTARGRQSATHTLGEFSKANDDMDALGDLGRRAATGMAFGGGVGVASAGLRWHQAVTGTMSKAAQDRLAAILLGDAKGLSKEVVKAKAYDRYQERKMRKRAEMAGKLTGNYVGRQGE